MKYGYDEHMVFFNSLSRDVTVGRNLSALGKSVLATAMPVMWNPAMIGKYGMNKSISVMLSDIENSIDKANDDDLIKPANQVGVG